MPRPSELKMVEPVVLASSKPFDHNDHADVHASEMSPDLVICEHPLINTFRRT